MKRKSVRNIKTTTKKTSRFKTDRKKLDDELLELWSKAVISRDNSCRHCNSQYRLSAHHIRVVRHRATRYSPENGLCLCWPCHSLQHNQPQLFHDRVIDIIGQAEYDRLRKISQVTVNFTNAQLLEIKDQLKRAIDV